MMSSRVPQLTMSSTAPSSSAPSIEFCLATGHCLTSGSKSQAQAVQGSCFRTRWNTFSPIVSSDFSFILLVLYPFQMQHMYNQLP